VVDEELGKETQALAVDLVLVAVHLEHLNEGKHRLSWAALDA
jgi:hypothetical protein